MGYVDTNNFDKTKYGSKKRQGIEGYGFSTLHAGKSSSSFEFNYCDSKTSGHKRFQRLFQEYIHVLIFLHY